jgi:D-aminopeptidase
MIKKYVQNFKESMSELYELVGHWVVDAEVHKEIGVPITAAEGDVWLVEAMRNVASGFAQFRMYENGSAHLRYLYAKNKKIMNELLDEAIAEAGKVGAKLVYTNDRDNHGVLKDAGFKSAGKRKNTEFSRWEKELV